MTLSHHQYYFPLFGKFRMKRINSSCHNADGEIIVHPKIECNPHLALIPITGMKCYRFHRLSRDYTFYIEPFQLLDFILAELTENHYLICESLRLRIV